MQFKMSLSVALVTLLAVSLPLSGCGSETASSNAGTEGTPGASSSSGASPAPEPEKAAKEKENVTKRKEYVKRPLKLPDVVAEFDGEKISRLELEDAIIRRFQRDSYARFTLFFGMMAHDSLARRGISVNELEIDDELIQVLETAQQDLDELLATKRYTLEYLRRQVRTRIAIKKFSIVIGRHSEEMVDEEINLLDPIILGELARDNELKLRPHGIPDEAYAIVNGKPIAQEEILYWSSLYLTEKKALKLIDELIAIRVDHALMERYGVEPDPETIKEGLDHNTGKAGGPERFSFSLAMEGYSLDQHIDLLRRTHGVRKILDQEPPRELLEEFYLPNRDEMRLGDRVRVRDLFFPAISYEAEASSPEQQWELAKAAADAAYAELEAGGTFDGEFVVKHAPKKTVRGAQGDLGWLTMDQSKFEFLRDRALAMKIGDVTPVFKARHGYHILGVMDKFDGLDFDAAWAHPKYKNRILKKWAILGKKTLRRHERNRHEVVVHATFESETAD